MGCGLRPSAGDTGPVITSRYPSCAPAGYRVPREVIAVAVRWYLRYGLSYRDAQATDGAADDLSPCHKRIGSRHAAPCAAGRSCHTSRRCRGSSVERACTMWSTNYLKLLPVIDQPECPNTPLGRTRDLVGWFGVDQRGVDEERLKRHHLTDEEWARLEPLLPVNAVQGARWKDHRMVINGIFHRTRTGTVWRDLPRSASGSGTQSPDHGT
jgi:hypothetical protein